MITAKSTVRVEWVEGKPPEAPPDTGTSSAAAGSEGARPLATKLIARMKRGGRGKIAHRRPHSQVNGWGFGRLFVSCAAFRKE